MSTIFGIKEFSRNSVVMLKKTWNLNLAQTKVSPFAIGISAYDCIKLAFSIAYLSTHKFDVICISETFLDSDISH